MCYQVRQSFAPGEVDAETALQIGYDFAMRWTKGKHAFFVVSHIDRPHPHVHIYYNSTTLDCTRKFRDFLGSARAVRRLSDRICLENGLSIIVNPKLRSKGKHQHYGQWLGRNKPPTFQERLKAQIDICLAERPPDMDTFLQAMASAGFEVKYRQGGGISFRTEGQERFTRLRSSSWHGLWPGGHIGGNRGPGRSCGAAQGQSDCGYSIPYAGRKGPLMNSGPRYIT